MKLVGKLQDGTVFFEKGHGEEEKLFEFKTDEGKWRSVYVFIQYLFLWIQYLFLVMWMIDVLKLDTEQVIDGLDKAVLTMKKGEVALLTIAPEYAFGASQSQQELVVIPANSTVYYEVELVSFDKVS